MNKKVYRVERKKILKRATKHGKENHLTPEIRGHEMK